jgi:integrase
MAMMRKKMTDRVAAQIPLPTSGRTDIWDVITPGFGLRVSASGSRTWIAMIRREGERNASRITLGKFPQMSTAAARTAAQPLLTGEGTPGRRGGLFQDLAQRFLTHARDRRGRPVRPNTTRLYTFVLNQAAAHLHDRPITKISRADIAELLEVIATERGSATAALARSALSRFFGWLVEIGMLEINPVTRSPSYSVEPRRHVLNDGELRAIWNAPDTQFRSVLRLLLLTAARRSEVGGLRWSEVDPEAGIWSIPPERTKSKRGLILPLVPVAIEEIQRQPQLPGRDTIFGGGSPRGLTEWGQAKARLDKIIQLARPWRIHDLRRTVRTRLHKLGVSPDVIRRTLNHDLGPISAAYDQHDYLPEMRAALDLWAGELSLITAQPGAEVVQMC